MGTKTPGDLRSGRKTTTKCAKIEFVGCRTTKGAVWEEEMEIEDQGTIKIETVGNKTGIQRSRSIFFLWKLFW